MSAGDKRMFGGKAAFQRRKSWTNLDEAASAGEHENSTEEPSSARSRAFNMFADDQRSVVSEIAEARQNVEPAKKKKKKQTESE